MNTPAHGHAVATPLTVPTPTQPRRTLSPELLRLIDHDPRFGIGTIDGRWLDPYTGEAVDAPQGSRAAAIKHLLERNDWQERRPMGMGEIAVRKHYHDLTVLLPQEERLRVRDREHACWVNPYTGSCESVVSLADAAPLEESQRMLMARCLARTGHLSKGMLPFNHLLNGDRHILPLAGQSAGGATTTTVVYRGSPTTSVVSPDTGSVRRTATAVFRGLPSVDGWECAADARAYDAVGGDFYEIHPTSEHQLLVALGDVSGHGMNGAKAATALLKHLRRSLVDTQDICELAVELNRECCESLPRGTFITLFLCMIDTRDGRGTFLNCGHHPPLLISPGDSQLVQSLGDACMALGLTTADVFAQRLQANSFTIAPGAMLVQCSDGILEAAKPQGEEFGLHRYAATVLAHMHGSCRRVVQNVLNAARAWRGATIEDDCTVLAIRRSPPADTHEA